MKAPWKRGRPLESWVEREASCKVIGFFFPSPESATTNDFFFFFSVRIDIYIYMCSCVRMCLCINIHDTDVWHTYDSVKVVTAQ